MCFKNLEGKSERESPNRTISTTGGLGPLHAICISYFNMGFHMIPFEFLDYITINSI